MAFYSWQKIITNKNHQSLVYDATNNSVWAIDTAPNGVMVKIRATDGAYLDASGNVTNLAGATFAGGNGYAGAAGIAGRKIYVGCQTTNVRRFNADTGAFEYQYPTAYYPTSAFNSVTVGGYCWFSNAVQGVPALDGIQGFDANGNTVFRSCDVGGGVGGRPAYLCTDGTYIYFVDTSRNRYVWKIHPGTGAVSRALVMSSTYGASQLVSISCDGTYLWLGTGNDTFIWKVRCSDLAPIDAAGNVCTEASNNNRFTLRNGTLYATTCYASIYDGEVIWVAPGTVDKQHAIVDQATGYNGANLWGPSTQASTASKVPILAAGYLWFPYINSPDIWRVQSLKAVLPNLTDVSPGGGPHISLTFDNPVGITGPTFGPAVEGILVTGASQISSTQIDLALTAASQPPAAPIGSATNDLGPEAPSGGAVTSDPTPAVPVAGAFREPT